MNQVSLIINKNIPIMSIFNLQNIRNHWIRSLTPNEILTRDLKIRRVLLPEFINKIRI